ncbi:MAG: hypothetical protein ACI4JB_07710 [Porcipelethomonas sp.]
MDSSNIFPLSFEIHLAFVCIAIVFFIFRFARTRRLYQIFVTVAVFLTLLLYVNSGKLWYYCVGFAELGLMLAALVSAVIDRRKLKAAQGAEAGNTADNTEE